MNITESPGCNHGWASANVPGSLWTGKKAPLTFCSEILWIGKNLKKKNPLNSFELLQSRKLPIIDLYSHAHPQTSFLNFCRKRDTWREPTQRWVEHANSTQKGLIPDQTHNFLAATALASNRILSELEMSKEKIMSCKVTVLYFCFHFHMC